MDIKIISRTLGKEDKEGTLRDLHDPHKMTPLFFRTLERFAELMEIPVNQILVCCDNTVAGHLFAFPMRLRCRGNEVEGVSGMDLFVCEEYRKYGHGIILLEEFFETTKAQVFEAYGISEMAEPLYKFCGSTTAQVSELNLSVRSRLKLMLACGGWLRFLSPVVDVLLWCYRLYLGRKLSPVTPYNWRELEKIPTEVNEIVFADKHPYAELHDARYLQALKDCDTSSNRRFTGVYQGEEMLGFYLTEEKKRRISVNGKPAVHKAGRVLEWGTKDEARLPEKLLLLHALLQFKGRVDSASVHVMEPDVVDFLKNTCKMRLKMRHNWGIKIGSESPCAELPGINDISNWRVRTSMGDVGLY